MVKGVGRGLSGMSKGDTFCIVKIIHSSAKKKEILGGSEAWVLEAVCVGDQWYATCIVIV